jgi:hypothetical protein
MRIITNGAIESEGSFLITDFAVTSGVTNFPAATKGDIRKVTSAGWLGGAAGVGEYVNVGDMLFCVTSTVAGTKAAVYNPPGQYWSIIPAMVSMPDGYRDAEWASNTSAPTLTNGFYWLNNVLYKVENSVHQSLGLVEDDRLTVTFDGGGTTAIAANKKAVMTVPFNCTITGGQLLASKALGTAGVVSIAIGIWREATPANYDGASSHPVVGDSITTGGTKPTVTAGNRAAVSVASWASVTLLKGEVLVFNADSVTDTVIANLTLYVTKN